MESYVIQNNGVKVEVREELGRVLVAMKDFNTLFEVVIREHPALLWESEKFNQTPLSSFQNFLDAYSEASMDLKQSILQLYHPPLNESSPLVMSLKPIAKQLSSYTCFHQDLILKLIAIVATNAHQYYGYQETSNGDLHQHERFNQVQSCNKKALYLFGSKVQHSCCPNSTYTSKTPDGSLAYKVIQNIKAGEEVSFSYIGELYYTPAHERRDRLLEGKDFWCMCKRCCGPDFCRVAKCSECGELSPSKPIQIDSTSSAWSCWKCCSPTRENDVLEKRLHDQLKLIIATTRAETPTRPIYDLIKAATKNLSTTHYIAIRGWLQLSTLYASKAAEKERMIQMSSFLPSSALELTRKVSELSVKELRQKAALTGLRAVSLIECVANECYGCKPGEFRHSPVYESSSKVFHACIDLVDIPSSMYPHDAKKMVKRYIPYLYATFGDDDDDVKEIERVILSSNSETRECENCKQKKKNLLLCSRCNLVWYCGKDCQVKHWNCTHKQQCVPSC